MSKPALTKIVRPAKQPSVGRDVADKWSAAIAVKGFTPVANAFLNNYYRLPKPLKPTEAMFVIHLMSFKWDKDAPYPSFKTLAERMRVTPTAARGHARSLEKKGYLRREMQIGTTNKFHLDGLFRALELLIRRDEKDELLGTSVSPAPYSTLRKLRTSGGGSQQTAVVSA